MYRLIACLTFFLLSSSLLGQVMDYAFAKGRIGFDEGGASMANIPNIGYAVGGYTEDSALVMCLNDNDQVLWSTTFDAGTTADYIHELIYTSDNHIVGIGTGRTAGNFNPYGFVFKMDLAGNIVWTSRLEAQGNYLWAASIAEGMDGNYNICGSYLSNKQVNFVCEINPTNGAIVWENVLARNSLSNGSDESFNALSIDSVNNCTYLTGRFQTGAGQMSYRPSLTKVDSQGDLLWSNTYLYGLSGGGRLYSYDIAQDGDSLVIHLLGRLGGTGTPFSCGIMKTDTSGNIGWAKWYQSSTNLDLRIYSMDILPDGYIFHGWINSANKSTVLLKTNKTGVVQWSHEYGAAGDEDIHIVIGKGSAMFKNGQIIGVGRSDSYSPGKDICFIKVDAQTGNLDDQSCFSPVSITTTNLPAFQLSYPMVEGTLPFTQTNVVNNASPVLLDLEGNIREYVSDSVASMDVYYACNDTLIFRANYPSGMNFLWNTGATTDTIHVNSSGVYWLDVSDASGCALWSDTVWVNMNSLDVTLPLDTGICVGDSILLTPIIQGNPLAYLWHDGSGQPSFTASVSGTYWVEVSDGSCAGSDTIDVTVVMPPTVALGQDTTFCDGDSFILNASQPGGSYEWQDLSVNSSFTVSSPGNYWVNVSVNGCSNSDTLEVQMTPIPMVDLGADVYLCVGDTVELDVFDHMITAYQWNTGTYTSEELITQPGQYIVEVWNGDCYNADTIEVVVINDPDIQLMDTVLCEGNSLSINLQSPQTNFVWDYSGTHELVTDSEGVYYVTISDQCGNRRDSLSLEIDQTCFCEIYVPNAFTPNGDAANDIFKAVSTCEFSYFKLSIFNRWGEVIFETENIEDGWNGSYSGFTKMDLYVWKVDYQLDGTYDFQEKIGHVMLVR